MVTEESLAELRQRRDGVLKEYAIVKVTLSREHVVDGNGNRLEPAAYHRWRAPHVRRYNELAAELVELNARLRELRDEGR